MRTTIALDPDVVARLKRLCRRGDVRLEVVANAALREGLGMMEAGCRSPAEPWTKPMSLGGARLESPDNIAEALS
jgi:hypothetical protein